MDGLRLVYEVHGLYLWLSLLVLLVVLGVWLAIVQAGLNNMLAHYRSLCRGASGGNLQELLEHHLLRVQDTSDRLDELGLHHVKLDKRVRKALQRVGIVRFNPFSDVGGDQSFSVALLDIEGDGLVMSSLFGRKESRVYVKPVENGQSKYALSDEEQQAIHLAGPHGTADR